MISSREKLVTTGRTDERTNNSESIGPTSIVGGSKNKVNPTTHRPKCRNPRRRFYGKECLIIIKVDKRTTRTGDRVRNSTLFQK